MCAPGQALYVIKCESIQHGKKKKNKNKKKEKKKTSATSSCHSKKRRHRPVLLLEARRGDTREKLEGARAGLAHVRHVAQVAHVHVADVW